VSTELAANIVDTPSRRSRFLRERSGPAPTTAGTATTTPDRPASRPATADGLREPERDDAIVFDSVSLAFDEQVVLRDLSFRIQRGATMILLGGSGAGKSVVLKLILGLLRPDAGTIYVQGHRIDNMAERDLLRLRTDIGMLFQENALFDSLTVDENVGYRLYEEADMPREAVRVRVEEVLAFVGMRSFIDAMPSTLSGGERRRVAIARAMVSRPGLLLFDDPTTGLDPIIATTVDREILKLRDLEHVTSLVVTHQIRDAFYIATHEAVQRDGQVAILAADDRKAAQTEFMVLHEGRIRFRGRASELLASQDVYLREFLYKTRPPW
jgi:phospholipid/cholesterol/gamma-HCH transport system ATP-binding protein